VARSTSFLSTGTGTKVRQPFLSPRTVAVSDKWQLFQNEAASKTWLSEQQNVARRAHGEQCTRVKRQEVYPVGQRQEQANGVNAVALRVSGLSKS